MKDRDPRCSGHRTVKGPKGPYTKPCNKLLVAGEVTRPWSITCPRCGTVTSKG